MVTRDTNWPEGTPCWVDLAVDDFDKGTAFYSRLLGWEVQRGPAEFGGYSVCTKDGRSAAGLMPKMDPSQQTAWTVYLAVEDIDACLAKVRDNGGQVMSEAMDVGDMGRMALFADPGGAFTGLWQGGSHTGFQLANEPGSVTWNENYSRDWERNREFYTAVFGYTYDDIDMEGMEYATISVGGQMVGGIGQIAPPLPQDTPPHWSVCFKVDDADGALALVRDMGGAVLQEGEDTEYGRLGMAADDQGATFWMMADVAEP